MTQVGKLGYDQISFPDLGIGFTLKSDAFTIFGLTIKWYGVIIAIGIVLAMLFSYSKMKKFGLDSDRTVDAIFAGIIGGVIGARLYYVIMQWDVYKGDWKQIFNLRNGGLAIYGGIIGAVLFGAIVAKIRKVKFLPLLDIAGVCFLIGQGIGRWGNFANHEAFGYNTSLPWGMSSGKIQQQLTELSSQALANGSQQLASKLSPNYPVHPCFLYESLWCILGFVLLAWFMKHRKFDGQLFLMYIGWYGLGRFFIEGLRTDSLMLGNIRVSQALAAICVITSVILLIVIGQKVKNKGDDYVLYCDTEESKQLLKEAEEKYNKNKHKDVDTVSKNETEEFVSSDDVSAVQTENNSNEENNEEENNGK
jgi:phosphatidylglycerol:prolipoprotein diacylglycerol transferase